MIKITSNALKVKNALGSIDEILNRAMHESLRQTAQYASREGARQIVSSKFAPKLTASDIVSIGENKKQKEALVRIRFTGNSGTPWQEQERVVIFSQSSLKAMFFAPVDTVHQTRRGKRWGVSVVMGGVRKETGGFHLRGAGRAMERVTGKSTWYKNDYVFVREGTTIRPFHFPSIADLLRRSNGVETLEKKCAEKMETYTIRNFNRHSQMVWKDIEKLKF